MAAPTVATDNLRLSYGFLYSALAFALLLFLYWDVAVSLVHDWNHDPGASHGFLVPPLALATAWLGRKKTLSEPALEDRRGLFVTAAAAFLYLMGKWGADFFLTRVSLIVMILGLIWTSWGWLRLRTLLLPTLLLFTMLPWPALVYNRVSIPLQLFSSKIAAFILQALGHSVFLDGNVLYLANITLGVAEACNGLRSLSSLLAFSIIVGFLDFRSVLGRVLLLCTAVGVALGVNVLRVTGTALLAEQNAALAQGFYHIIEGWVVFVAGMALFWLLSRALRRTGL